MQQKINQNPTLILCTHSNCYIYVVYFFFLHNFLTDSLKGLKIIYWCFCGKNLLLELWHT
jgi:hypothetical protein